MYWKECNDWNWCSNFFLRGPTSQLGVSDGISGNLERISISLVRFNMVRGTEVHDGLKFQEKYLQRESAKKIFFFDLQNS